MHLGRRLVFVVALGAMLLPARAVFAADELQAVLHKLDAASANFHTTSADFEFDSVQSYPVPDKDVQKGTIYFERKGHAFQMGIHINEENGRPVPKVVTFVDGIFKLYEKLIDQVTVSKKAGKYESYMALGFGASGKELQEKWNIKDLGPEALDGVQTEKLELVPKDPEVLKLFPKVTIWIDTERGVNLKQVFDEGQGQYRVCVYFNIKMNQELPRDAFSFKTDKHTTFVQR